MGRILPLLAGLVIALSGCGQAGHYAPMKSSGGTSPGPTGGPEAAEEQRALGEGEAGAIGGMMEAMQGRLKAAPAPANPPPNPIPRKIVRTADVHLIVQDFDQAELELRQLIA